MKLYILVEYFSFLSIFYIRKEISEICVAGCVCEFPLKKWLEQTPGDQIEGHAQGKERSLSWLVRHWQKRRLPGETEVTGDKSIWILSWSNRKPVTKKQRNIEVILIHKFWSDWEQTQPVDWGKYLCTKPGDFLNVISL